MSGLSRRQARGECPACGMPLSFAQANLRRRGRWFGCQGCGKQLVIPKVSVGLAVGGFAMLSFFGKQFGLASVLVALVAISGFEWLFVKVRLAAVQPDQAE